MGARPHKSFSDLEVVNDKNGGKGPSVPYFMLSSTLVAFQIRVLA